MVADRIVPTTTTKIKIKQNEYFEQRIKCLQGNIKSVKL